MTVVERAPLPIPSPGRPPTAITVEIAAGIVLKFFHLNCSGPIPADRLPNRRCRHQRCHRRRRLYRLEPLPDPIGSRSPSLPSEPVTLWVFRPNYGPSWSQFPPLWAPPILTTPGLMESPNARTLSSSQPPSTSLFPTWFRLPPIAAVAVAADVFAVVDSTASGVPAVAGFPYGHPAGVRVDCWVRTVSACFRTYRGIFSDPRFRFLYTCIPLSWHGLTCWYFSDLRFSLQYLFIIYCFY